MSPVAPLLSVFIIKASVLSADSVYLLFCEFFYLAIEYTHFSINEQMCIFMMNLFSLLAILVHFLGS